MGVEISGNLTSPSSVSVKLPELPKQQTCCRHYWHATPGMRHNGAAQERWGEAGCKGAATCRDRHMRVATNSCRTLRAEHVFHGGRDAGGFVVDEELEAVGADELHRLLHHSARWLPRCARRWRCTRKIALHGLAADTQEASARPRQSAGGERARNHRPDEYNPQNSMNGSKSMSVLWSK